LKNENTGKTDASHRIITSSRSKLIIVTSTINLTFSFVLEFPYPASNKLPITSI
jgi:hypothetical protein